MMDRQNDMLQRLLDYELNQDDPAGRNETASLIDQDEDASVLHESLRSVLAPLSRWEDSEAPSGLIERTTAYIKQHDQAGEMARMSETIATGETESPRSRPVTLKVAGDSESPPRRSRRVYILGYLRDIAAVAACLLVVFLVSHSPLMQPTGSTPDYNYASFANKNAVPRVQPEELQALITGQAGTTGRGWLNTGGLSQRRAMTAGATQSAGRTLHLRISPEQLRVMEQLAGVENQPYNIHLQIDKAGKLELGLRPTELPLETILSDNSDSLNTPEGFLYPSDN